MIFCQLAGEYAGEYLNYLVYSPIYVHLLIASYKVIFIPACMAFYPSIQMLSDIRQCQLNTTIIIYYVLLLLLYYYYILYTTIIYYIEIIV